MKKAKLLIILLALCMTFTSSVYASEYGWELSQVDTSYINDYDMIEDISDETIIGADCSYFSSMQEWDKSWKDKRGKTCNSISVLQSAGINTATVKVAVNPSGTNEYLSLERGKKALDEAENLGMRRNVVILFSDEMTYGGWQPLPDAWKSAQSNEELLEKAKDHMNEIMNALNLSETDIVTLGNEINWNFLGITDYQGWQALKVLSEDVKKRDINVSIGIAMPNNPEGIKYVINELRNNGVQFDYIGVNVYPANGMNDTELNENIEIMRDTFIQSTKDMDSKPQLYISKVSYKRNDEKYSDDLEEEQAKGIYNTLAATVSSENAGGIVYDRAVIVDDWENSSLFDELGSIASSVLIFEKAKTGEIMEPVYRNVNCYGIQSDIKDVQVNINKIPGMMDDTIRGMDISSIDALEKAGVKFYDFDGNEEPLMKVISDNGVNYVRIRIWNDPYNENHEVYGGGVNDVDCGLRIASQAAKYGMKVLLCFQYSDFWTSPATHMLPKAWEADKDDPELLAQHVYDFTKETLEKFNAIEGLNIGMVQIGNEITSGMMGLDNTTQNGTLVRIWDNENDSKIMNNYLKAGIKATRELCPEALIALHLETINVSKYKKAMDTWQRDEVDYDVLGTSYYPFYNRSKNSNVPKNLAAIQKLAESYGKDLAVLETSWMYTLEEGDGTTNTIGSGKENLADCFELSPQGQVDALTEMYETLLKRPSGLGAFYWEPAWIPVKAGWRNWDYNKKIADEIGTGWASKGALGYEIESRMYYDGKPIWGGSSWENHALFDLNGHPLQSLKFYSQSVSNERLPMEIKLSETEMMYDGKVKKPSVTVTMGGVVVAENLTETNSDFSITYSKGCKNAGTYTVKVVGTGKYAGYTEESQFTINPVKISSLSLSKNTYVYDGTLKRPKVTVKAGAFTPASAITKSNSKVTITYDSGRKKVGTYKVTIKGKGNYTGTKTAKFKIIPAKTTLEAVTGGKKSLKITWKKKSVQCSGYQVKYSKSSNFNSAKTVTVKGYKTTSKTIKKLSSKTKYYVKVRTYKTVGGVKYYSDWSTSKYAKTL